MRYLDQAAAIPLALCNGNNRVADLPELLRLAFDLAEPPATEVHDCLELLVNEGLII